MKYADIVVGAYYLKQDGRIYRVMDKRRMLRLVIVSQIKYMVYDGQGKLVSDYALTSATEFIDGIVYRVKPKIPIHSRRKKKVYKYENFRSDVLSPIKKRRRNIGPD